MATLKPDLTRVWASSAPPINVEDPDSVTPGKVAAGWVIEVPPFEQFNFLQQWFTQGLAHANEQGIMVWDTNSEYVVSGIVKGSDTNIYRSIVATNQGNDPISSPVQWELLNLGRVYNTNVTYGIGDNAFTTNGDLYKSLTAGNQGNDPAASPSDWFVGVNLPAQVVKYPRNFIDGFQMQNDSGGDVDHDIIINPGACIDSTNTRDMLLNSAITKQIDVDWVEGTGQGGFPSGIVLAPTTWYHIFVIIKADGTVDSGFDSSVTATNLLADATDYTEFRRVGSVLSTGIQNIKFFRQQGDYFYFISPTSEVLPASATAHVITANVPTGVQVMAILSFDIATLNINARIAVIEDTTTGAGIHDIHTSGSAGYGTGLVEILTSTSATFSYIITQAGTLPGAAINSRGWKDFRGKE